MTNGTLVNTITSNAQFVNYQADGSGDYHLTSSSPCIDAGTSQVRPRRTWTGPPGPRVPASTSVLMNGAGELTA